MKISVTDAPSLTAVIRADRAPTTGFDYLRLGLAVAILLEHVLYVTFGEAYNDMVA